MKACTHTPICGESAVESAVELSDSSPELADYTTDFVIVSRLPVSNMCNIFTLIQSADSSRPTIAIGGLQIGPVSMGLKDLPKPTLLGDL